jgi:hypothetical protein
MGERLLRPRAAVNGCDIECDAMPITRLVAGEAVAADNIIMRGGHIAIRAISSLGTWEIGLGRVGALRACFSQSEEVGVS